jgi:hypothetical protein
MSLVTPELAGRAAEDFSTALDNVFNDEVLWRPDVANLPRLVHE